MNKDPLTRKVIGCAVEVHRVLGPGLLESTYQQCFAHELSLQSVQYKSEYPLRVKYKDIQLDCGYRIDLFIENRLVVELKAVDRILGIHKAQLLTYMKITNAETGLLINFNEKKLIDGVQRFKL